MYEKYLFYIPLNEMYYGKHPLFKKLEEDIVQLKKIINPSGLSLFGGNAVKKTQIAISSLPPNIRDKLKKKTNNNNNIDSSLISSNLDNEDKKKKVLERIDFLFKQNKFELENQKEEKIDLKNLSDEECELLITSLLNSAISSESNPLKLKLKKGLQLLTNTCILYLYNIMHKKINRNIDVKKKVNQVLLKYIKNVDSYFIPSPEKMDKYKEIISSMIDSLTKIFHFKNLTIEILNNPQTDNACIMTIDRRFDEYRYYKFADKASNKTAVRNWINKNKLYSVRSDDNSIFFKPTEKIIDSIYITSGLFSALEPKEILAVLLHEIGHAFGLKVLNIEYLNNGYFHEKFADAFAAKFGYGFHLISALNKIRDYFSTFKFDLILSRNKLDQNKFLQLMNSNNHIIPDYIKTKTMISMILPYFKESDVHPNFLTRSKYIYQDLDIERDNPRLSEFKKKELENDIDRIRKVAHEYKSKTSTDLASNYDYNINNLITKIPEFKANATKAEMRLNSKIIRDILDQIYDNCMNN